MRVALELFIGGVDACHLAGALGGFARVGSPRFRQHRVGERGVGFGVDHLVLRPRDGGQHVGDNLGWIVEIAVMHEPEARELLLEEFDRLRPIHHPRVFRQAELRMEPADDIETEGVERADPHRGRSLGPLASDPLRHLARRLVRKGQQQDAPRIDALFQKAFDARDQRLRLSGAGTRFEQIGFPRCAAAAACSGLSGRSTCVAAVAGGTGGSSKASNNCCATTSNGAPSFAAMAEAESPSSTWSARATLRGSSNSRANRSIWTSRRCLRP